MTVGIWCLSGGAAPPERAMINRVLRSCRGKWTRYNRYTHVHFCQQTPIEKLPAGPQLPTGAR